MPIPLTFRDDYVQSAPRVGYIASHRKAYALLCSLTAPDLNFRRLAREEYRNLPETAPVTDGSAWDIIIQFDNVEWQEAWNGCTCAEEMRLLFEAKGSFRLKYTKTPRTEYICTHLKPYALLYALTFPGHADHTRTWWRMYGQAGKFERLLPANLGEARREIMAQNGSFWVKKVWELCQNDEQMALLFECKPS